MSARHTTVQLEIEKLAYGGAGVGHLDGKVCFVEGALPGETVEVQVTRNKSRYAWAKLRNVITASKDRQTPRCEHIEICGGCQYQHTSYEAELRWKTIQVQEYMQRQLGLSEDKVAPIKAGPEPYHTRMHFTARLSKSGKLGYVAKDNRSVFEIKHCPLLESELEQTLSANYGEGAHGAKLTFRVDKNRAVVPAHEKKLYAVDVGGRTIWAHSAAFFQANRDAAAKIGETLKAIIETVQPEWFCDLFAGCGLFSLLSAPSVGKIFLAENNQHSLAALEKNFEKTSQEVVMAEGNAGELFKEWYVREKPKRAAIFLDPPRQGLDPQFAAELAVIEDAPLLCYLSCHLGSLTRDLGKILAKGNWIVEKVAPFDMFPRTKHIEILTVLKSRKSS